MLLFEWGLRHEEEKGKGQTEGERRGSMRKHKREWMQTETWTEEQSVIMSIEIGREAEERETGRGGERRRRWYYIIHH